MMSLVILSLFCQAPDYARAGTPIYTYQSRDAFSTRMNRYLWLRTKYTVEMMGQGTPVTLLDGTRTALLFRVDGRRKIVNTRLTPWEYKIDLKTFWVLVDGDIPVAFQEFCPMSKIKICKPPG